MTRRKKDVATRNFAYPLSVPPGPLIKPARLATADFTIQVEITAEMTGGGNGTRRHEMAWRSLI
jgi:hypothetical protein